MGSWERDKKIHWRHAWPSLRTHNQLNSVWLIFLKLSVKITAASDAHMSVSTHVAQASTLVCRSAASQMNPIKCQHVMAASPAIVAAWTRWHVQAAGTGSPERDINYLKWDDLQKKASSGTWHIISVLFKCDLGVHFVPRKQCPDTSIPKNKKWGEWFSEVSEHSVHLDLNGASLCLTLRRGV